ncbi:GIN domain-containing protein [Bacteroidota bacterium]
MPLQNLLNGSGKVKVSGSTTNMFVKLAGSGSVNLYDFPSENCIVKLMGSGSCRVICNNNFEVIASGSGNVYYKGDCDETITVTGSGNVYRRIMEDN